MIRDSSAYGEGGVALDGADHNRILRTTICGGMSNALSIGGGSDFNLIKDNLIPDLPDEGGGSCGGYIGQDGLTQG